MIGYRSLRMTGEARRLGLVRLRCRGAYHCAGGTLAGSGNQTFTSPAMQRRKRLHANSGRCGPRVPTSLRRTCWTPQSSSRRSVHWCPPHCVPWSKAARWSAPASTCSPIPSFPYDILWGERVVRSVANLTRSDGEESHSLAPKVPVKTRPLQYPLEQANQALDDLRAGRLQGAAVLRINHSAR